MQHSHRRFWLALLGMSLCLPSAAQAHGHHSQDHAVLASVSVAELPAEARRTLQLIREGGPFLYPRDGVVFGNFEKHLPKRAHGYYREYTVRTPGARNRGARRIVCGPVPECYYSGDHYRTFRRIVEGKRTAGGR